LSVAPAMVSADADSPENPEKVPLVSVNVPDVLRVPVPDSVPPVRVMLPPLFAEGPAPNGKLHVVTVLVPAVCVNVTRLKVFTVQARVAEAVPLKSTVPPLAVKMGVPDIVNAPALCIVPAGAVKVPLESVKATLVVSVA
jgi:hypothetical protein